MIDLEPQGYGSVELRFASFTASSLNQSSA